MEENSLLTNSMYVQDNGKRVKLDPSYEKFIPRKLYI